ncbi:MAG TPA: STN and carboxypeptidase regulatory-like domain-containing protein, partial [Bacteroidia bacterium]|nr:STN and carboxypeptidase regulatory-like domain-containing protein [Bacteroidia bacterium]
MSESINYFYFLFCLLFTCFGKLNAQQIPYLERTVTLHATNQALNEVFNDINSQTGAVFSYTKTVDDRRKVNINCQRKPLRLVLNELLKGTYCTYKIKDKYIIVKCETQPVSPPSLITGYIYSITDSSIIPQASIYVKQTKNSAVSNDYGFFSLSYSNKLPNITVSFAKEDYKDTSLVIYNQDKQEVLIYLYPKTAATEIDEDTTMQTQQPVAIKDSVLSAKQDSIQLHKNFINKLLENSKKIRFNLRNISDTLFSKFSVSLTPYISTNRLLSVNTVNKYAFNIFGGYSLGTEAFELGGIFNIDKGNANGVQLAGVFNLVGDSVTGAQIGGLFNVT